MRLKPGDVAPALELTDQDGRKVSSRELRGRRYLVYFYPKDDTPGCTVEACQFNENLTAFDALGVPVLGISRDSAASHRRFREKYSLRLPLLTDADGSAHRAYGAWGERPGRGEGVIRSTFLIDPKGRMEQVWYSVRADGHAQAVLKALRQE